MNTFEPTDLSPEVTPGLRTKSLRNKTTIEINSRNVQGDTSQRGNLEFLTGVSPARTKARRFEVRV